MKEFWEDYCRALEDTTYCKTFYRKHKIAYIVPIACIGVSIYQLYRSNKYLKKANNYLEMCENVETYNL